MILKFKNVVIHNFLSYGHAEIDLQDKHFCRVKGVNLSEADNATSNGSGKSSWSSAICWALTGETIQGLSSNIKNINVDENLCYVELEFLADNNAFKIIRYKNPKSELKIELNGSDISGKGIRESEEILSRYLPDLTSQLIASTIILGQGLPNKFTANTPSGRKEVLENLSKSDFMIQDLKSRISTRASTLQSELRVVEDTLLTESTKRSVIDAAVNRLKQTLQELSGHQNYDVKIYNLEKALLADKLALENISAELSKYQSIFDAKSSELAEETKTQDLEISKETSEFDLFKSEYFTTKSNLTSSIKTLSSYIENIKTIKDICPTCGQKLPNVAKPNVDKEESELLELQAELVSLENRYQEMLELYNANIAEIKKNNADKINALSSQLIDAKNQISTYSNQIKIYQDKILRSEIELNTEKTNKAELSNKIAACESELKSCLSDLDISLKITEDANIRHKELSERIQIVNQLNTLIKRDFRGYLLADIIDFINRKCREYCLHIFGTDAIEFVLNGNNIDISYSGKSFENLSGGEKQRIDLIIQFAIRNMMEQYLNFSSNILVLDEIFDQMDSVGCESILQLITSKIADVESIFIISHRADELEIPADYQLTVIKNNQGVTAVEWR